MKFKFTFVALLALIAGVFAYSAKAQGQFDVYGSTTTRLLLPVGYYGGTNTLNPTFTVNSIQAQPNPINANQTNMVLVDTNYQWDVSHFIGRGEITFMGATNNAAPGSLLIISSNTVYGTLTTNAFYFAAGGTTTTNQLQVIPFDFSANGRYLWYQYTVTGASLSNWFGLGLTGRLKDN
jgi:hypothetical protein